MSDYRRFIAYLYEYPNNRKGGCCGFVRVESQNGFCRMDFQIKPPSLPPETSVTVYGFIRRSGRMYGIPLGNLLAGRSSTRGKLLTHSDAIGQTDVTLDERGGLILLCRQTGVIATQWDDLPIQPEFFAPTLPQEPKTSEDNGTRPTEEKTAETPEPLAPAVPAQSLPSSDASKAQFDELSTEFSSNSEPYPQNSSPESTVSTESTSTDTVNTVPADRITQSSANTLHPASAESVKTAESYPSANPEPPQPIPDSAAQPLHMTSVDIPAAAAVPPSRAALYLLLLSIRRKQFQINKGAVKFFPVIYQLLIHTGRLAQRDPDHITVHTEKQFCFREYIRLIQIELLVHFPNAFRSECIFPSHLFSSILKTGIICW